MNWTNFLPAAVRDIHLESSYFDEESVSSNSSYGYRQHRVKSSRYYNDSGMSCSNYLSVDEADQYYLEQEGESYDEDFQRFLHQLDQQQANPGIPYHRHPEIMLHKSRDKKTERLSFLDSLLNFTSQNPEKRKFHRHCIPAGLPKAPSMVDNYDDDDDDGSDIYDLPRPPSLIYEYHITR